MRIPLIAVHFRKPLQSSPTGNPHNFENYKLIKSQVQQTKTVMQKEISFH